MITMIQTVRCSLKVELALEVADTVQSVALVQAKQLEGQEKQWVPDK